MGDIKTLQAFSEPLTFELEPNPVLNPPTITLRLMPTSPFGVAFVSSDTVKTDIFTDYVLEAIGEWDVKSAGRPLECNAVTKRQLRESFKILFGTRIKGQDQLFGVALFAYLADAENFLKN